MHDSVSLEQIHHSDGRSTNLQVRLPTGMSLEEVGGLALCLHGAGYTGSTMIDVLGDVADRVGFALVCPDALPEVGPDFNVSGLAGSKFKGPRWTYGPDSLPLVALASVTDRIRSSPVPCVVVGHSLGAIAAWNVAARYWPQFAGLMSLAGTSSMWELFGPDSAVRHLEQNLQSTPVLAVHGSQDTQIPVRLITATLDRIRRAGLVDHQLHIVESGQHALRTLLDVRTEMLVESFLSSIASSHRPGASTEGPDRCASVRHHAIHADHGQAKWLEITPVPRRKASVCARIDSSRRIAIECTNVARALLSVDATIFEPLDGPIDIETPRGSFAVEPQPTHSALRQTDIRLEIAFSETSEVISVQQI